MTRWNWAAFGLIAALLVPAASRADYMIIRVSLSDASAAPLPPGGGDEDGFGGGFGGFGGRGQPGFGGGDEGDGFGNPGAAPDKPKPVFDPENMVMAVIQLTHPFKVQSLGGRPLPFIRHQWTADPKTGGTYLEETTNISIDLVQERTPRDTLSLRLKNAKQTAESLLQNANWALDHGLIDEVAYLLDRITKEYGEGEEKEKASPKIKAVIDAYSKLKADMNSAKATPTDELKQWQRDLGYDKTATSEHYVMLHKKQSANDPEVMRRLRLLEQNYKGFFYWFAVQGQVVPVPAQRLVALLTEETREFGSARDAFFVNHLHTDGFLARRQNVAVFAPRRLDGPYADLDEIIRNLYTAGWEVDKLLKGDLSALPKPKPGQTDVDKLASDFARAQALVLTHRAQQEESDLATATHEGTRQLLSAIGWMPERVEAPEWAEFALAQFFATPMGPFPASSSQIQAPFWSSVGGPSWAFMRFIQELNVEGKLAPDPEETLRQIVTDQIFSEARAVKPKPKPKPQHVPMGGEGYPDEGGYPGAFPGAAPGGMAAPGRGGFGRAGPGGFGGNMPGEGPGAGPGRPGEKPKPAVVERDPRYIAIQRAKALSWSLAYFLFEQKFDGLRTYCQELDNLPRDLPLSDEVKLTIFARAFDLLGEDGQPSRSRMKSFADEWLRYTREQQSPVVAVKLDPPISAADAAPPMQGGFPGGGFPGGGFPGAGCGGGLDDF